MSDKQCSFFTNVLTSEQDIISFTFTMSDHEKLTSLDSLHYAAANSYFSF